MPELQVEFYYWVMPIETLEWEVMQRGKHDCWYRIGSERFISDRRIAQVGPMIDSPRIIKRKKKEEKTQMEEFIQAAIDAGFSESEANFMWLHVAKKPHTHETDEIIGLDELIEESIEEAAGDDDDDDDDEES